MTSAKRVAGKLVGLIMVRRCGLCSSKSQNQAICAPCFNDLPWINHACGRCGTPLVLALPPGVDCAACQRDAPPYVSAYAPLHYAFPVDALIKAFKFGRQQSLAPTLAAAALPWLVKRSTAVDALVPVPLHRRRHAIRGFNQAVELARQLRAATGLPIRACARRRRHTPPQSGLDASDRRRNVRDAFRVVRAPRCRHALLIDDVMTTGETCRALSLALLSAGVERVSVLTIARASIASYKPGTDA